MTNVASLELCKELYELSGWSDVTYEYWGVQKRLYLKTINATDSDATPAYDLDYLLRRLNYQLHLQKAGNKWLAKNSAYGNEYGKADTPEDATCKLAIELIKQGVFKP